MDLIWTDFVNSEWHDWRGSGLSEDRLENQEWFRSYMDKWHLKVPVPPSPKVIQELKSFRSELRTMASVLAEGGSLTDKDLAYVNRMLGGGFVQRSIARDGNGLKWNLVSRNLDWANLRAEIAADFADTLVNGDGHRVRVCENTDCLWVFYDDTRNRSKRYCDDKLCGNLMKVRRFRSRTKTVGSP